MRAGVRSLLRVGVPALFPVTGNPALVAVRGRGKQMRWLAGFAALALASILALAGCAPATETTRRGIQVGSVAPDVVLQGLDGSTASLDEYRGQVVLLNFWATWCEPCRDEIPDLEAAYQAGQEGGFVVLGLAVEEPQETVAPFVQEMGMTYPVFLDVQGSVKKVFRVSGLPMSLLIDQEGVIRVRHVGHLSSDQLAEYLQDLEP